MGTTVPTAPTRPRTLVVASAFGTGSVIMYFGGLFALYFSIRADALAWEPSGTRRGRSNWCRAA